MLAMLSLVVVSISVKGIQKAHIHWGVGKYFIYALDDLCSGEQGLSGKAHDQSFVFGAFIFLEQFRVADTGTCASSVSLTKEASRRKNGPLVGIMLE